ncbi:AlpA family phage regulatory protein [Colwellia sp. MB02u-10]|uniref:helix-turn-helix transcriptional regulator n=1 Tax=Colwellia sp. MB02u-10 TaxID=2759828 RepID=UPI0015F42D13|nr:AlpA family phage regulatory protein [Colwellia sp. MB02u-10]
MSLNQSSPLYHSRNVLSVNEVCIYCNFGRTALYDMLAKGLFVKRIRLTQRRVGFLRSEVDSWLDKRKYS